jgi:hypothetical protein
MDEICAFLHTLCQTERLGGRIVQDGPDTVIITDLACWTGDMYEDLLHAHPFVKMEIRSSTLSLGGFELRLRFPEVADYSAMFWLTFHAGVIAITAYLLGWLTPL